MLEADSFHPDALRAGTISACSRPPAGDPGCARGRGARRRSSSAAPRGAGSGGYSLGMRQRLSVAGALLGEPELLVLDEPANGLDPEGIRWLRDFLRSFAAGGGTVLISSHVLAEVAQLADEVVIIHHGTAGHAGAAGDADRRAPPAAPSCAAPEPRGCLAASCAEARNRGDAGRPRASCGWRRPPERVGEIAAAAGIVLHELRPEGATLEEVFLELTVGEGRRDPARPRRAAEAGHDAAACSGSGCCCSRSRCS